jgi:hypothetical protein
LDMPLAGQSLHNPEFVAGNADGQYSMVPSIRLRYVDRFEWLATPCRRHSRTVDKAQRWTAYSRPCWRVIIDSTVLPSGRVIVQHRSCLHPIRKTMEGDQISKKDRRSCTRANFWVPERADRSSCVNPKSGFAITSTRRKKEQ